MDKNIVYVEPAKLLLERVETGFFEPRMYDVDSKTKKGRIIEKDDFFYDFIYYIRESSKQELKSKNSIGRVILGHLEIYQWWIAFSFFMCMMRGQAEKFITVVARQAGKSYVVRKIVAFLVVYYAHHFDVKHDRFFVTFTNIKKELVKGQLDKLLPEIRKAVESFNKKYPDTPIEWGETTGKIADKLLNNTEIIQFNKVVNGRSLPYSQIDILSLNDKVISVGISSHLLILDESQNMNYEHVSKMAEPFLFSTKGNAFIIGTANSQAESALYNYYKNEAIEDSNKLVLTWEDVRDYKKVVSEENMLDYSISIEQFIRERGKHSTVVQTECYCNFNLTGDRFTSIEELKNNNVLELDIEDNISHYADNDVYKIGCFDGAIKLDRASYVGGLAYINDEKEVIKVELKQAEVIKEAGTSGNPDVLIDKLVELCINNKLDYLMVDNTSNMIYLTIQIYNKLKEKNIGTQLVPFDFSGVKKSNMFSYVENMLLNQTYKFPKLEYTEQNIAYGYIIEELCNLKRIKKQNGDFTYEAPKGNEFFDDFAVVSVMLGYSMDFILKCIIEYKKIIIKDIWYRLYLRKYIDSNIQQIKPQPQQQYMNIL